MAPTNSRCFGLECHQAPPVSPDMAKAVRTLVLIHYRNHVGDLAAWPPRSLHCWCSTTTCGCLWTRLSGWDGGTAAGRPERILGTTPVLACGRQPACTGGAARALLACAACSTRWIRARCSCSPHPSGCKQHTRRQRRSHGSRLGLVLRGSGTTDAGGTGAHCGKLKGLDRATKCGSLRHQPHTGGVSAGPRC
ncbi:uncharacterized protein LOC144156131 isoform X2 [Haemaphysalis longicornis]